MNIPQTADVSVKSFFPHTVYTAGDFSGYTLKHALAMYPQSWKEAARHFGVALPEQLSKLQELTVEQIKHKAMPSAMLRKSHNKSGISIRLL